MKALVACLKNLSEAKGKAESILDKIDLCGFRGKLKYGLNENLL